MGSTSIEWTDLSINPIRARRVGSTGDGLGKGVGHFCQRISPGCAKCYSATFQPRFGLPQFPGPNKSPADMGLEMFLDDSRLADLLKRRKPARVFWCDMTDMFGEWVPFEWVDRCFATMALTPHLTHQILTKRPARMAEYLGRKTADDFVRRPGEHHPHSSYAAVIDMMAEDPSLEFRPRGWPLPNVWLGTSVEDQTRADERIPHLLRTPAAVRFLSVEPMLGPVNLPGLTRVPDKIHILTPSERRAVGAAATMTYKPRVDWVIVGGESGGGARPCDVAWVRSIVGQCAAAGVACFVKQLGSGQPSLHTAIGRGRHLRDGDAETIIRDPKGGTPDEWPSDLRVRQFPEVRQ